MFWTPDGESYMLHAKIKKKNAIGEIGIFTMIFTCFGPVLYEGSMEGV